MPQAVQTLAAQAGFAADSESLLSLYDNNGGIKNLYVAMSEPFGVFDTASLCEEIRKRFSKDFLKNCSFEIKGLTKTQLIRR